MGVGDGGEMRCGQWVVVSGQEGSRFSSIFDSRFPLKVKRGFACGEEPSPCPLPEYRLSLPTTWRPSYKRLCCGKGVLSAAREFSRDKGVSHHAFFCGRRPVGFGTVWSRRTG